MSSVDCLRDDKVMTHALSLTRYLIIYYILFMIYYFLSNRIFHRLCNILWTIDII